MEALLTLCLALALPTPVGDVDTSVDGAPPAAIESTTTSKRLWAWNNGTSGVGLSMAEHGTQAMVWGGPMQLFSTFDPQPPSPVWSSPFYVWNGTRGATETDTVVGSTLEIVGVFDAEALLTLHTSASPDPVWTYSYGIWSFPLPFYDISRDGQTIVSLFESGFTPDREVRIHDLATGVPTTTWSLPVTTWTQRFDLSPDGTVAAYSDYDGTGVTELVDLATGVVLFSTPGSLPPDQGLSNGGEVVITKERIADVGWLLKVQSHATGVWRDVVKVATGLTDYPQEMAVSDDGTVAVAAWWNDAEPWKVTVRAYDAVTGDLLMERTQGEPGGDYDNYTGDVAISADGTRFVMGTWGTGVPGPSELVVYDPWADVNVASFPLAGSVFETILSADGRYLLVNRILVHATQGHQFKFAEMYEIGGADLAAVGVPALGETVRLDVYGEEGTPAILLAALALAPAPIPVGVGGELVLDPDTLIILGLGPIGSLGWASLDLEVPVLASLVGLSLYTQGATTGPKALGDTWLKITVLP
jgi:hypothetical protein